MEAVWRYFKIQLPGYLRALPLPRTFGGFLDLTREEWLTLLPFFITMAILFYLMVVPFANLCFKKEKRPRINRKQQMDASKVATKFDIEDLGDKKVFCRCWKSNRFPYCDGTHNTHNKETGDNVGPLIVTQTEQEGDNKTGKGSKKEE